LERIGRSRLFTEQHNYILFNELKDNNGTIKAAKERIIEETGYDFSNTTLLNCAKSNGLVYQEKKIANCVSDTNKFDKVEYAQYVNN
jgi:hypothetical protein